MSLNSNGRISSKQNETENNKSPTLSGATITPSESLPTNARPDHGLPKYTLPIPPKPKNEKQKIIYEKEKLLSIFAKPGEPWEEREARVNERRRSLEVAAMARWGANLKDLDMLDAEKQRWKEHDEAKARGEIH